MSLCSRRPGGEGRGGRFREVLGQSQGRRFWRDRPGDGRRELPVKGYRGVRSPCSGGTSSARRGAPESRQRCDARGREGAGGLCGASGPGGL